MEPEPSSPRTASMASEAIPSAMGAPPAATLKPKGRLMIRQMVLDNFKSYAGEQYVGPFDKSFSAVVGPNGSGKSNVIDAMLFVFGRRANQMRFKKVSELIHRSSHHANLEYAKVSVHFQEIIDHEDGGDGYDVIPGSDFIVCRTATRSNESHYSLDGRKVSVGDVVKLLKSKGIDLDNNRFLILQGEVESISMMKPKAENEHSTGLLEYLEDIIGTDQYKQPIEEEGKKLEEVGERRLGLISRLKVAEKEVEALRGKRDEAQDYLDKQSEMYRLRIHAFAIYTHTVQEGLAKSDEKAAVLAEKLEKEVAKEGSYAADVKAAETALQAAQAEATAAQKALEDAEEAFKVLSRKDVQCQESKKHLKTKLVKAAEKKAADLKEIEALDQQLSVLEGSIPEKQEQAASLSQQLTKEEEILETMVQGIKGEVEALHSQLREVKSELVPWERQISEVNSRAGTLTAERDLLVKTGTDAAKRLADAVSGIETARESCTAHQKAVKEGEVALKECKSHLSTQQAAVTQAKAEEVSLLAQVAEARERANGLQADVGSSRSQTQLVSRIMEATKRGELNVLGRLGDLAAIDAQYDVAVSTAVGGLDWFVVETVSDAQRVMEYLRVHQLGVATCLALDKQQHLMAAATAGRMEAPEGVPRLFDLIKCKDARLLPAFLHTMGNTVVASNLEQASRIAYGSDKRFKKVVTLQGQLISDSGTMSGGGKPSRGRMALGKAAPKNLDAKAAEAELAQAQAQLQAANQALSTCCSRLATAEAAVKAAEKRSADLETALPKARMRSEAEAAKAQDLEARLSELQAAAQVNAADELRIGELDAALEAEQSALKSLKSKSHGLHEKAAKLQAAIEGAGGEKLAKQRAKVASLSKQIEVLETDVAKAGVQVKAKRKALDKAKKDMTKDAKEVEKVTAEIAQNQVDMKAVEDEAFAVMESKAVAEGVVQSSSAALVEVKEKHDLLASKASIIRSTQAEIRSALDKLAQVKKEETAKINHWAKDTASCRRKLADIAAFSPATAAVSTSTTSVAPMDVDPEPGNHSNSVSDTEGHLDLTLDPEALVLKATYLDSELVKLNPDMDTIAQYAAQEVQLQARIAELDTATAERDVTRRNYEGLRKRRLEEFMAGFNIISLRLKELYQMITLGGDAELELVDSLDPFAEGIVFSVRPPKKSWKNISNLSGGEKTLSSLSLVFALHHYKPTPLYVMDEIDAALDFKNVSIVGHYIKERTRNAQFVIISLRNNMFELADRLVGIFKTDDCTKTVTINPAQFAVTSSGAAGSAAAAAATESAAASGAGAAGDGGVGGLKQSGKGGSVGLTPGGRRVAGATPGSGNGIGARAAAAVAKRRLSAAIGVTPGRPVAAASPAVAAQ